MSDTRKLRVGILFGGRSSEHDVSLQSAKNVLAAIDRKKYRVIPMKIPRSGRFDMRAVRRFDVVFPVMHGTYGEDGTMQGFLKLLGVPYIGPDVLGSAVGMDKDVSKRLLRDAGIPIADFIVLRRGDPPSPRLRGARSLCPSWTEVRRRLGPIVFVKPANQGSSVGVGKARTDRELARAVKEAFRYDRKILIEEAVDGREIECAVLGNEHPRASMLGEIIPRHEFYSYEAKYLDENGAALDIPARLPERLVDKGRALAIRACRTLGLEGMARVDFFLTNNGRFLVNEANTIPGFTRISMYPKLWEASGLPYRRLIDELIRLAVARHERERRLKTSR